MITPTLRRNMAGTAAFLATAPLLFGAGFQLAERSTTGLGRAFSGESAIGDDASVIASNPAGMALLPGDTSISAGLAYIMPSVDVQGSSDLSALGGPAAVPSADQDVISEAAVPYFYAARRINDKVSVGLGSFTQFGLSTEYTPNAYITGKSELISFNLNPSISYRVNDQLTIGAGFSAVYSDVTLTGNLPPAFMGPGEVLRLEGDDWGFGWNIGLLYEFNERTRVGLNYRSEIDYTFKGTGTNLLIPGAAGGPAVNASATAELTTPDVLEFSLYHELNDQWAVHGDVMWTGWSDFQTLTAEYGGAVPLINNTENWQDSMRFAVGATYAHSDTLTLRCGVAYDESPVRSSSFRTLRIPDGDRVWASVGASYQLNPCYRLDFGYTHIFDTSAFIDEPAGGNGVFTGTASGHVNLVALGVSGTF